MNPITILISILIYLAGALLIPLTAQEEPVTPEEQAVSIDSLIAVLERAYVFPEKAAEMGRYLQEQQKAGAYTNLTDPFAFAEQMATDLRAVTNDKHLRVHFDPQGNQMMRLQEERESAEDGPDESFLKMMKRNNYGFKEVKILDGNVGYLDLRGFMPAAWGGETAAAVMNYLAHTDAIIFDLRKNGGGDPAMIQLLTSYLYDVDDRVHLNSFYFRPNDETTQTWTLPYVPGQRNPGAEVYVLTSSYTFSAAEEFTYNLKNLERATIIGETTGGGAHPGGMQPIADRFVAFVPVGRAINPITKTNWEGTGVTPHVETSADEALATAHRMAMEKLAGRAGSEEDKKYFAWFAEAMEAKEAPAELTAEQIKACTGQFGSRRLFIEEGQLHYQRGDRPREALTAASPTSFFFKDDPGVKLILEIKNGQAVALVIEGVEGWKERNAREEAQP